MMKRYEIWRGRVKFEESGEEIKERPVLLWGGQAFLVAYKMTGTDRGDNRDEYRVRHWKESGLEKPTSIRIRKVLKLENTDLVCKIGELDKRDRLLFELRIAP